MPEHIELILRADAFLRVLQNLFLDMLLRDLYDIIVIRTGKTLITCQDEVCDLPGPARLSFTHLQERIIDIFGTSVKFHQALRTKCEERTDLLVLDLGFTHLRSTDELHGVRHLRNIRDAFDTFFNIVQTLHGPYASRCWYSLCSVTNIE